MRSAIRPAIVTFTLVLGLAAQLVHALDSRANIDRSVELIQAGDYSLARVYLAPALIDYRLSAGERSRAYYLHGYSYFAQGLFVSASKDYSRALEFNAENPAALAALGDLYFQGRGVEPDEALAVTLLESAAGLGNPRAQVQVGFAYLTGRGTDKDLARARESLAKAAEAGDTRAMMYMALSYRPGWTDAPEPDQARAWYEKAREEGEVDALLGLAFMHQEGEFGQPDDAAALDLFLSAAEQDSATALASLGHIYLTGRGTERDLDKARDYFEAAARQEAPSGLLGLGHMEQQGLAGDIDLEAAMSAYLKAAELGVPEAQMRLAYLLLEEGEDARAHVWAAKAAAQDSPRAQNDYAWMLSTSKRDELRDGTVALEFARRAVNEDRRISYLDTLAAAYAELGRYTEAIETQQQAIALMNDQLEDMNAELAAELQSHLDAYRAGKPWRE